MQVDVKQEVEPRDTARKSVAPQPSKIPKINIYFHGFLASLVAVALVVIGYMLNHQALDEGVFLLVPSCTGLALAFMARGVRLLAITSLTSLMLSLLVLVYTGVEGVVCVLLAFPILFIGIGIGACVGYLIGRKFIHRYGNITVVTVCLVLMSLVGWTNDEMKNPEELIVETTLHFDAPMDRVWSAVVDTGSLEGNDSVLSALALPIPIRCELDGSRRVCYFEEGEMLQEVITSKYGHEFKVKIVESLHVRDWVKFKNAGYTFVQGDGYVDVTRRDKITSTLLPRWYWHWFETQCVQLEHRYVMESMKRKAELKE